VAEVLLCRVDALAPGTASRFDVDGHRIALARVGDAFYALGDRCSHEDFSLAEGEVDEATCEIECARHGANFDLKTGAAMTFPATKPVQTYEVRVDGDEVKVVLP
jgi:3-phenylpropionate/trans-cinnamate dioxygenase ferredoxin subunit